MRAVLFLTLALLGGAALTGPARAYGGVTVRLPPPEVIAQAASPEFLQALVTANVIGVNCAGYKVTDGEWALLVGTADQVARVLGLSTDKYDAEYYGPAFDLLDQPGACAAHGPQVAAMIGRLKEMGGGTEPIG